MSASWLVIGAGVSGRGAAEFLCQKNTSVRISEHTHLDEPTRFWLESLGAEVRDGGHDPAHLEGISHVVPSPGLPPDHPLLQAARTRGLAFVSEIDLALGEYGGRVVGVTGTNGKSTTCAMTAHLLERCGVSVSLGGNFGRPPSSLLANGEMKDTLVLELSSYQLEQSRAVHCDVALMTGLSEDHLGHHGSMDAYLKAKWRLFEQMKPDGLAVVPADVALQAEKQGLPSPPAKAMWRLVREDDKSEFDPSTAICIRRKKQGQRWSFPSGTVAPSVLSAWPLHDLYNASLAAAAASHLTGQPAAELVEKLEGYRGLPHRFESLGTLQGRPVINDSKSTNLESTQMAVRSLTEKGVVFLGGRGKGESFAPLAAETRRIERIVAFGEEAKTIEKDLKDSFPVEAYPSLKEALSHWDDLCRRTAGPLLFSPGCASFDEFKNFEERGEFFRRHVSAFLDPTEDS